MEYNIVLTGASRGLGLEILHLLLKRGANVYCLNRCNSDALQSTGAAYPGRVHFAQCDLAHAAHLEENCLKAFLPYSIPIHGFVNNAAMAYDDLVTNLHVGRLEEMYRVNVFSPMVLTRYAIRNMLLHRISGSIVHISSISAHTGYKGLAMYASTKGALEAFSKNVAREWGEKKIRSNCVVAGFMETEMSSGLSSAQRARIYARTALKTATHGGCVAQTVMFLLGSDSGSITGQNIHVDCGTI